MSPSSRSPSSPVTLKIHDKQQWKYILTKPIHGSQKIPGGRNNPYGGWGGEEGEVDTWEEEGERRGRKERGKRKKRGVSRRSVGDRRIKCIKIGRASCRERVSSPV